MPTLTELATELGIPVETLAAKSDVVAKWNGYFTDADTKYSAAMAAEQKAQADLARVQTEQQAINDQIAKFGVTEATNAALRANNAAMEASLKTMKEQGFDVTIPAPVAAPPVKPEFNPDGFRQDVNRTLIDGFNVMNRYQRIYGKALPEDLDVLAREAAIHRKDFTQYVAEKFDFSGEEKRQQEAVQAKRDADIAAKAVNEYKEKNPVVQGNPNLTPGLASRAPHILTPRTEADRKGFANMSTRQKIMESVNRTKQTLASQAS